MRVQSCTYQTIVETELHFAPDSRGRVSWIHKPASGRVTGEILVIQLRPYPSTHDSYETIVSNSMRRIHKLARQRLGCRFELSHSPPLAYALFDTALRAPRITSPSLKSAAHWPRGVTMLRFDFTGFGNSEGDVADTNFSSNFADVIYAADYQREHHGAPKVLVDHSLGEIVALAAAQQVA
jgi:hypothetical protein